MKQPISLTGYSGTPLAKKLGIKQGFSVYVCSPPPGYEALLAPLPMGFIDVKVCAVSDVWSALTTGVHQEARSHRKCIFL